MCHIRMCLLLLLLKNNLYNKTEPLFLEFNKLMQRQVLAFKKGSK